MLDLHVLGTSSARPTTERAVSGSIVRTEEGLVVLDPGEGFQDRFAAARRHLRTVPGEPRLRSRRVGAVLLSHGHLDHTWGLLPWMQSSGLDGRTEPLEVAGPVAPSTLDFLEANGLNGGLPEEVPTADVLRQVLVWRGLGATGDRLGFPVRWRLGDAASGRWVGIEDDGSLRFGLDARWSPLGWAQHTLVPLVSSHSVPSCGWRVEREAGQGRVDLAQVEALSLHEDERFRLFREGHLDREGGRIALDDLRAEGPPALSLVVSGDTAAPGLHGPPTDLLVHEATFLDSEQDKADAHLHSTASGAAQTAMAIGARALALTHFSARISDASASLAEARTVLSGQLPCTTLQDGDRLRVVADGAVEHHRRRAEGWTVTRLAESRR